MLIKCPECGNEISDKATHCIHCGFPLSNTSNSKLSNEQCPLCKSNNHILKGIEDVCAVCGYVFNADEIKKSNSSYEPYSKNQQNTPKCPKCGSTAITAGARGVNFTWGFIGASKTVNRCANCGHTWKP